MLYPDTIQLSHYQAATSFEKKRTMASSTKPFSFQGHRGARGLAPENTLPSFLKCLELGINAFELDVVITKDRQVLVSHEAWFNPAITTKPNGKPLTKLEAHRHLIYQLNYEDIQLYDCGKRGHPKFPEQVAMPVSKPLLSDVMDVCNEYAQSYGLAPVLYNIEIKSYKNGTEGYGVYNPPPDEFAELVYDVVMGKGMEKQCILQSFDIRIVQAMQQIHRDLRLSLLVENTDSLATNIDRLGFVPSVYAPYYELITEDMLAQAHARDMEVITWTVNDPVDMYRLIEMGVDGMITDYPNRFRELLAM